MVQLSAWAQRIHIETVAKFPYFMNEYEYVQKKER